MADILDAAQTSQPAPTDTGNSGMGTTPQQNPVSPTPPPPPPVEPAPEPPLKMDQSPVTVPEPPEPAAPQPIPVIDKTAPSSDSLIVPPLSSEDTAKEKPSLTTETKPAESAVPPKPSEVKPKKKTMSASVKVTMVLLLLVTLPLTVWGALNTLNLFGYACSTEDSGYCAKIKANQIKKNNPNPPATNLTGGTPGTYNSNLPQPPGTYKVDCGGAGCAVPYRYIQAPGVFEGAVNRALGIGTADGKPSQADLNLLSSQYGLNGDNLNKAAQALKAGQTWVPGGVGCTGTPETDSICGSWHWTTCVSAGGQNGIGCTTGGGGNGGNNNPPNPPNPPVCTSIAAYKDGNALSASELSALNVGDTITLGFAPAGNATKVRFRVNSGAWNVTTAHTLSNTALFTWDYTLADTTSFNIEAQWFDGTNWN